MLTLQALLLGIVLSLGAAAQDKSLPQVPDPEPTAVVCSVGDKATQDACIKAMTASYTYNYERHQYDIESLHHRAESIRWSLLASEIMFVVVLILVFSGLLFAAIQFRLAMRPVVVAPEKNLKPTAATNPPAPNLETNIELSDKGLKMQSSVPNPPAPNLETNFELSDKGLKMQSSVLGVIILALSMAFFYLYAAFVYPIRELSRQGNDVAQGPGK